MYINYSYQDGSYMLQSDSSAEIAMDNTAFY